MATALHDSLSLSVTRTSRNDPDLAECFRETVLSIEMPGLDSGGIVDVTYPWTIGARGGLL